LFATIFQDFNLPNAATWFYFSLLLAVALFFKFSRLLSLRNWDVLALFLLVPGLLLRQEATEPQPAAPEADSPTAQAANGEAKPAGNSSNRLLWFAYLWLLCGSGYFMARCLMDLALVRRPALSPNLNLGGLAWLASALFICLIVVAVRRPIEPTETSQPTFPLGDGVKKRVADAVEAGSSADATSTTTLWVGRVMALLCLLAVVVGLVFIGWRHFQDVSAGMAAATFCLLLPYSALAFREFPVLALAHVWPSALLVWAIAAYRLPSLAGALVGIAAGTIYFPALTLPVWLGFYWRRGVGRFAGFFLLGLALGLAATGLILLQEGELAASIKRALERTDWQPWNVPSAVGFWRGVHWAYRLPVFIAYMAFVLTTAFWPSPKNLAHLLALLAAVLIGIQFWFANQGGIYVLWYLPFLLLMAFRPNLSDRVPLAIHAETDGLHRLGRRALRSIKKRLGIPEPAAPVR
jgi:hypothetical protein